MIVAFHTNHYDGPNLGISRGATEQDVADDIIFQLQEIGEADSVTSILCYAEGEDGPGFQLSDSIESLVMGALSV